MEADASDRGGSVPSAGDAAFVGSVPAMYERLLVPMIFQEPARALAAAVSSLRPADVLETAAGTGVLTRALTAGGLRTTATDLNAAMLDLAATLCPSDLVTWQVADALALPFPDSSFDAVACQFGAMFFPDKVAGYAEAARVLRAGGSFVFSVWDRLEANAIARVVMEALEAAAPGEPLDFLRRTPYGHFDGETIGRHLEAAGFAEVRMETVEGTSRTTAAEGALACCQGTPLRAALEASSLGLDRATAIATEALTARFGSGPLAAPTAWIQIAALRR